MALEGGSPRGGGQVWGCRGSARTREVGASMPGEQTDACGVAVSCAPLGTNAEPAPARDGHVAGCVKRLGLGLGPRRKLGL